MKLTKQGIDNKINSISYFRVANTTVTICAIKLTNGFVVTGQSACIDLEQFDEQTGKDLAYENAVDKIWELEGYAACERRHEAFDAEQNWHASSVNENSICVTVRDLFTTPMMHFNQEQNEIVSQIWNELEGKADRAQTLPQKTQRLALDIHKKVSVQKAYHD